MTAPVRELHTGWAAHRSLEDTFLVYAECDDEATQVVMIQPTAELRRTYLVPTDEVATSPAYRVLIADHRERCAACQAWEAMP